MAVLNAGRKRIYVAFSRALVGRGFSIEGDVAISADKLIKVEFFGPNWNLYINNKQVFTYEMISGSMQKLEHVVKTLGLGDSIKTLEIKPKQKQPQKNNEPESIAKIIDDIL